VSPRTAQVFVPGGASSSAFGDASETRARLAQLRAAMSDAGLDAVYLEGWADVAWLCGGRGNRVVLDSPSGQCGVLVTATAAQVIAHNNEEGRLRSEVFGDLPLPIASRPWYEPALSQAAAVRVPAGARWAADVAASSAGDALPLLRGLRRLMQTGDTARYRALGRDTAEALESALVETGPAWTELAVAAAIEAELRSRDVVAPVVLVGGTARAALYRHLVPTPAEVGDGLIASVTAVRHGLHASLTRSVAFGLAPPSRRERHAAVVSVDAAYLAAGLLGTTLGQAFRAGEAAYTAADYYGDWNEHHQGGTTGYAGREVFATEDSAEVIEVGTALAWNPTVPGAKSEDTVLVADDGLEWLTRAPESQWPLVEDPGHPGLPRTAILEL
jgi:Xaa-Pro aminopeptidase